MGSRLVRHALPERSRLPAVSSSVDDGKSTLIGRLLYDSKLVFSDHLAALESDSKTVGTQGGDLDFGVIRPGG